MSKFLGRLGLLGLFVLSFANATEMRSPYLSERGPIRYKFERDNEDRYTLDLYGLAYSREAHKAFKKHGTNTETLSSLFFNKSDFSIAEIFPDCTLDADAEYYNPYMDMIQVHPRVTYAEKGINVGGRFEYPIWKDKGRLGIRMNIPFRAIEIERKNITDKMDDPSKDYILSRLVELETGADSVVLNDVQRTVSAYSFDLISRLFQDSSRTPAVQAAANSFKVFGQQLAAPTAGFDANKAMVADLGSPVAGVIYKEAGTGTPGRPSEPTGARLAEHWAFNNQDTTATRDYTNAYVNSDGDSAGGVASPIIKAAVFFKDDVDYSAAATLTNLKNEGWLILGYDNGSLDPGATNIKNGIEDALKLYSENPYEWLWNYGGFEFETDRKTGLGDIDVDFFYEHRFNDDWAAELMFGVRLPTGTDDDFSQNPYKAHLGNGEHWEVKIGGMAAWRPSDWISFKLDSYFSFVLQATEKRTAVFEGSLIKNIGPQVDADVDWNYFVARLDSTMFHPKTKDIYATFGYEFYYKTEDNIHFKNATITPFYGDHFQTGASLAANLDEDLAQANTESIGHKFRTEVGVQINEWFELVGGAAYTFAGKNLPREFDMHGGFNVSF